MEHVGQQHVAGRVAEPAAEREEREVARAEEAGVFTLMLEGELGVKELAEVGDELFRLMQRGVRQVVLDFSDVPHLDYRGVKPLLPRVDAFRRASAIRSRTRSDIR